MNRQRAYRKLMSRSATTRSNAIDVYEHLAFSKMTERPRPIPIVKLKIGEPLSNHQKRVRSVAELNNLRGNYNNYCHYRINGRREFPPLQPSPAPSPTPPSRDSTVIFMLRGTQRRSKATRKGSAASQPRLPVAPGQAPIPNQGFSGHLIVKRKDSTTPTAAANLAAASQRSIDVVTPTAPNSASDGIDGYEIRGSSVFRSNSELRDEEELDVYGHRMTTTTTRTSPGYITRQAADSHLPQQPRGNQRFMPRPGSYATSRQQRDLFSYENEHPGVRYDYRAVHGDIRRGLNNNGMTSRGMGSQRRVRFDENRTTANVSTYIFPIDERGLRLNTGSQHPLQLTQKNLEIFEYLHNPKNTFGPLMKMSEEQTDHLNRRVLDWVQERQLDMTALLRGATSEGDIVGIGLPPTPEVNEMNGTHDLDDPDLEVYDLTKEEDFLPHDEVIDAVIEEASCD